MTLPNMIWTPLLESTEYWFYRAGGFIALHVLDDPAWLALIFC